MSSHKYKVIKTLKGFYIIDDNGMRRQFDQSMCKYIQHGDEGIFINTAKGVKFIPDAEIQDGAPPQTGIVL